MPRMIISAMFPAFCLAQFFEPLTLSFKELQEDALFPTLAVEKALTQTGMIAISDIPGFQPLSEAVVRSSEECISTRTPTTFDDGTIRYSLAAENMKQFDVRHGECNEFNKGNMKFREYITTTLELFTSQLSRKIFVQLQQQNNNNNYYNFSKLIEDASIIEHFNTFIPSPTSDNNNEKNEELLLEWHTDSGLLLVFTPAIMADKKSPGGLMVQLSNSESREVKFASNVDLVFMFGDAVHTLINPTQTTTRVTSTVHALKAPVSTRWWYGRMLLPPSNMLHKGSGITYQELREHVIHANSFEKILSMGCSSQLLRPLAVGARALLQACRENEGMCWLVCAAISPEIRAGCIELDQVPVCDEHKGIFVACSNETVAPTSAPSVPPPTSGPHRPSGDESIGSDLAIAFGVLGAILFGAGMYVFKQRRASKRVSPVDVDLGTE